jgi:hypothetical protein
LDLHPFARLEEVRVRTKVPRSKGLWLAVLVMLMPSLGAGRAEAAAGAREWVASYVRRSPAYSTSVIVAPDGARVFVEGAVGNRAKLLAVAYDSLSGAELWRVRYSSPFRKGFAEPAELAVTPDGRRVFVSGTMKDQTASRSRIVVLMVDAATGHVDRVVTVRNGSVSSVAVGKAGRRLYVAGSRGRSRDADEFVGVYRVSSGSPIWERRIDLPASGPDGVADLALGGADVTITTTLRSPSGADIVTSVLAKDDGVRRWTRTYDGGRGDRASVVVAMGSTVVIAGSSKVIRDGAAYWDYVTRAYDATRGDVTWTTMIEGMAASASELPRACAPAGGGDFSLAGATEGASSSAIVVDTLDPVTGLPISSVTVDRAATDLPRALVCAPDGTTVAVTGMTWDTAQDAFDALTFAVDPATGTSRWIDVYDRAQADDYGAAAALDPEASKLFVTGQSSGTLAGGFVTIDYSFV